MSIYGQNLHMPYTCLVTRLRMSKKQSERQMADILKQIVNLKNHSQSKTKQQVLDQLRLSKQKLNSLRQKLKQQKKTQQQIYSVCRKRVHLDQQVVNKKKQMSKQQLLQQFDKQVIQFFVCRNKIKQAKAIQKSLQDNYEFQMYVELYQKAFMISQAIKNNDLRPLKDWCYEHSHYLTKIKSSLQFKLIACGFINILNNKNGTKAVQFLRKQVTTLNLSEQDKQQINKLAYLVLLAQRQSDYQYYSDSEQQKKKENIKNEEKKLNLSISGSSSSSQSVREALIAAQQNMRSIYRAIVDLAEDAQKLVNKAIKSPKQSNNIMSMENQFRNPVPEILIPQSALQLVEPQMYIQQQIYQQKFDSMSEQNQVEKQFQAIIQQKQKIIQNQNTNEGKKKVLNQQKKLPKVVMKEVKRKHKLDKNNLRQLLKQTKALFLQAFSKIYQLPFFPIFDKTLAVGISLLRTPNCTQNSCVNQFGPKSKQSCPICTTQVQIIMKKIPGTLRNQSSLICRVNGSLMNQINYPIALPNGQIYSITGLRSTQKNGKYYCLVQNKWFKKQACRKIFLT